MLVSPIDEDSSGSRRFPQNDRQGIFAVSGLQTRSNQFGTALVGQNAPKKPDVLFMNNKPGLPLKKICLVLLLPVLITLIIMLTAPFPPLPPLTSSSSSTATCPRAGRWPPITPANAGCRWITWWGSMSPPRKTCPEKTMTRNWSPRSRRWLTGCKPRAGPRPFCWFTASPSGSGQLLLTSAGHGAQVPGNRQGQGIPGPGGAVGPSTGAAYRRR